MFPELEKGGRTHVLTAAGGKKLGRAIAGDGVDLPGIQISGEASVPESLNHLGRKVVLQLPGGFFGWQLGLGGSLLL